MSVNSGPKVAHFRPSVHAAVLTVQSVKIPASTLILALLLGANARADDAPRLDATTLRQIHELSQSAGSGLANARVEIEPGQLDARLRLAPCEQIEAHLPPGTRAWGRTRIGLRCLRGATLWNVYLPVTVKVFAPAPVAGMALPAGTVLQAQHLDEAEVDWAAAKAPVLTDPSALIGRTLARALQPGQALRDGDLRQRQWFAAGDTVQVVARGVGFSVSGSGQALSAGLEGQSVRVRTEGGRVLSGQAVGANRVEVSL